MNKINIKNDIFASLDWLIEFITRLHQDVSAEWKKNFSHTRINLKKKCISKIKDDSTLLNLIWEYRDFITLNENIIHFVFSLDQLDDLVNTRVKTRNSIEYKIENYLLHHENGNVPVNKCLNDLFGVRIILSDNISHTDIRRHITEKYPKLRCIDSSKADYVATHVYFRNDNYSFPWELQIWRPADKNTNLKSHKTYKQGYTRWEHESKGGF